MEGGSSIQERDSERDQGVSTSNDEEIKGCGNFFCHPKGLAHRFIFLFFLCFLSFGSYFCYDNPAALQDHIKKDLDLSTSEYEWLYSIYSWPNVFLCFIGGLLIDRYFGIRLGTNIYMSITLVGQVVFALGAYVGQFPVMIVGRFIFGIGAESLAVAQNNYAVFWFQGKELNMVFGLQLSFARIGSTVNYLVMKSIYTWIEESFTGAQGLGIVLFIATATCVFSLFCGIVLGIMDKRAERILNREAQSSSEQVSLLDVKDFSAQFWMVTVICVAYYVTIFPFISIAKQFFMDKFDMDESAANTISSIVYLISAGASPVLGFVIDKVGKNILWIIVAVIATAGSHIMLGFISAWNPYIGMVLLGLSYSTLASSLWPLVSLIIPQYQLGTAYGVCQAVQNLGLAVISIITGLIIDNLGYTALDIFFLGSLGVALGSTILLWLLDRWRKGMLNMTPGERIKRLAKLEESGEQIQEIIEDQNRFSEAKPTTPRVSVLPPVETILSGQEKSDYEIIFGKEFNLILELGKDENENVIESKLKTN